MTRPLTTLALALALTLPLQAQQRIELINDPVADGIFVEDGVAGHQYIYDVYIASGGAGAFQVGGEDGPLGADGTFVGADSAWYRSPAADPSYTGMWQAWYSSSVGNSCGPWTGCEPVELNDPAGYGIFPNPNWVLDVYHSNWAGPLFEAGALVPWARDNTWHSPQDYGNTSEYFFPGPGFGCQATGEQGLAYHTVTGVFAGGAVGLQATLRVVSPYGPGDINWRIDAPVHGAIKGPNGAPVIHLDAETTTISVAAGGSQDLDIYAPSAWAGRVHLLLGSLSGSTPGLLVDGVNIPINFDFYTQFVLANESAPPFTNGFGTLDSSGNATTNISVGAGIAPASMIGSTLVHAAVILDLANPSSPLAAATNAVDLTFLP